SGTKKRITTGEEFECGVMICCASTARTSPVSTSVRANAGGAKQAAASASAAASSMHLRMGRSVIFDQPVAQAHLARGAGGHVLVVGHQHHGLAAGVDLGDQRQHVGGAL